MRVDGLLVVVVRKRIRNLRLGVYAPNGRVRVSVPLWLGDDAVRSALIGKLAWIRRQQARFEAQPRETRCEMVSGETHSFLGQPYRLQVVEAAGRGGVRCGDSVIELRVPPGTDVGYRTRLLHRWYRRQLEALLPPLIEEWEGKVGVRTAEWRIKRMKTRWGSCNPRARRIWLNLELAKKPVPCIEYVLLHELAHLIERSHDHRFAALMDQHMPLWRARRKQLNAAPLAHETWPD